MESLYRIKMVPCDNGERFPLMVKRNDSMPLYYPSVYLTSVVRVGGRQDATLAQHLRAIKFAYDWGTKHHINLEARFEAGEFLTLHEIDALAEDVYKRADSLLEGASLKEEAEERRSRQKVAHLESVRSKATKQTLSTVIAKTAGTRLWYIREYFDWLATKTIERITPRSPDYVALVSAKEIMKQLIDARIPAVNEQSDPKLGMEKETERHLLEVIDPKSPQNPWRDERVRVRNQLFIHMLLWLGIRRGEALGVRVDDVSFTDNSVQIHRTPNDKTDPRLYQPQTKTNDRLLPMEAGLAHLCLQYITKYRCENAPAAKM